MNHLKSARKHGKQFVVKMDIRGRVKTHKKLPPSSRAWRTRASTRLGSLGNNAREKEGAIEVTGEAAGVNLASSREVESRLAPTPPTAYLSLPGSLAFPGFLIIGFLVSSCSTSPLPLTCSELRLALI